MTEKAKPQKRAQFSIVEVDTTPGGKDLLFKRDDGEIRLIKFLTSIRGAEDIWFGFYVPENDHSIWPYVGVKVREMEFTVKKNGDYTNYTATKLIYDHESVQGKGSSAPPPPSTENIAASIFAKSSPLWFCMGYAKDMVLANHAKQPKASSLPEMLEEVVNIGAQMYLDVRKKVREQLSK